MRKKGTFVVFEGIDCSGTSTQATLLTANLRREGRVVMLTAEPSHGPVGQLIRSYFSGRLSTSFNRAAQDKFFGSLFAADRLDHVFNPVDGISMRLEAGIDVISTRYKYSSLAYNAEHEDERAFILAANNELPDPDLLIYLDCPLDVALSRMRERVSRETYEKDTRKLRNAIKNFKRIVDEFAGPKLVLDASRSKQALAEQILGFVRERLLGEVGDLVIGQSSD